MDFFDYQKYEYVHYHLKSLLREWQKLKLIFEAKLSIVDRLSPHTKYLLILSLWEFSERVYAANLVLHHFIQNVFEFCKTNQPSSMYLLYEPNRGFSLINFANRILNEIKFTIRKFKGIPTLPFKRLPYEFQSRLIALLPPRDCAAFKLTGNTALNIMNNRGQFSRYLTVVMDTTNYNIERKRHGGDLSYDVRIAEIFLKSDRHYIQKALSLFMDSTEKFDRAVEIVYGTYNCLDLNGPYTWKHVIQLMNVSKRTKNTCMGNGMLLEVEDYDAFFEAVVRWLKRRKGAVTIDIQCPYLMDAFNPRFKEFVENRTTFSVQFLGGDTYIRKKHPTL